MLYITISNNNKTKTKTNQRSNLYRIKYIQRVLAQFDVILIEVNHCKWMDVRMDGWMNGWLDSLIKDEQYLLIMISAIIINKKGNQRKNRIQKIAK